MVEKGGIESLKIRSKTMVAIVGACMLALLVGVVEAQPTLQTPPNNENMNDNTPVFRWSIVTDETENYRIVIAPGTKGSSPPWVDNCYENWLTDNVDDFNLPHTITIEGIPYSEFPDNVYSWAVRVENIENNEATAGPWSNVWYFRVDTVAPAAPTLVSPADGTYTNDNTPTFDWSDITDPSGVTYNLWVDNDADFSSPEIVQTGLTASTFTPTTELGEENYSWRVCAVDGAGNTGENSSTWTFLVDVTAPAAPTLVSPADGENTNDSTPTLSWNPVTDPDPGAGVLYYELWVDNKSDFSTAYLENLVGTSQTLDNLYWVDNLYYWRVRVWDNAGNVGAFSSVRVFRIDTVAPRAPPNIQISPSGWTSGTSFTISWNDPDDNAAIRKAYYKIDALPTSPTDGTLVEKLVGEITSFTLSITTDGAHTIYVWLQDNAGNVNHNNRASVVAYLDRTPPATPTITSPTHTEDVISSNRDPSFSWSAVGGPSPVTYSYMLFPYEAEWKTTSSTSVSYSAIPDGRYTFKLKASDTGGTSGTDTYSIIIDTLPPTVELTGFAAAATETGIGWMLTTTQSAFTLSGRVEPGATVTINGMSVPVAGDGSFSRSYNLSVGRNVFTIRVTDAGGNIIERTLAVEYVAAAAVPEAPPAPYPIIFIIAVIILIFVIVGLVFSLRRPRK